MAQEKESNTKQDANPNKHPVRAKREAKRAQGSTGEESTGGSREGNAGHQGNMGGTQGRR